MKINLSTVSSNIRIFTTVVFALACVTPGVAQSQPASTEPAVSQSKGSGQAFPTRAITVVVPFPTGGTADLLPRLIAPLLSRSLGVPVVVDNRPGASGAIGASIVAKAKPDGHTLLLVTPPRHRTSLRFIPVFRRKTSKNLLRLRKPGRINSVSHPVVMARRTIYAENC